MDRMKASAIAADAAIALQQVADKHGVQVTVGGGRYDPNVGTFKPKVEFSEPDAQRREFERNAPRFNLTGADYKRAIYFRGEKYALVGLNTRAPSYPLIVERGGKRFKMPETALLG